MPAKSELERRVPPFRRLHRGEQAMLALSIAAGEMGTRIETILREREPVLSHSRYNALRILRGANPGGLSCSEIGTRLLLPAPDVTRLMDPLVQRGLVTRTPDPSDRRVVLQELTRAGTNLLSNLDQDLSVVYNAISRGLGPRLLNCIVESSERVIATAQERHESLTSGTATGVAERSE